MIRMSKDLKADVIIIGAGIIGASCAFRMSKRGLDEPPGFTEGVDWDWLEPTLQAGVARFPWLAEIRLDHQACWWGYYEVTPDHNPILGRLPSAENWINAAGFSGHGVQQAPMVGRLIAEEIALGKAQSIDIDPLRIDLLFEKQIQKEHNIV